MSTQWRGGFKGREGLDYAVLFRLLDNQYKSQVEWDAAFADIRIMEVEALKVFHES